MTKSPTLISDIFVQADLISGPREYADFAAGAISPTISKLMSGITPMGGKLEIDARELQGRMVYEHLLEDKECAQSMDAFIEEASFVSAVTMLHSFANNEKIARTDHIFHRVNYYAAILGDTDAARYLHDEYRDGTFLQSAFTSGLRDMITKSNRPYEPGYEIDILVAGIQWILYDCEKYAMASNVTLAQITEARRLADPLGVASSDRMILAVVAAVDAEFVEKVRAKKEHIEAVLEDRAETRGRRAEDDADRARLIAAWRPYHPEFDKSQKKLVKSTQQDVAHSLANDRVRRWREEIRKKRHEVEEAPAVEAVTVTPKIEVVPFFELKSVTPGSTENELVRAYHEIAGQRLRLLTATHGDIVEMRRVLLADWPHAHDVVDALIGRLVPDKPIRVGPVLLVGSPGSGKTSIARIISQILCLPLTVYPCAAVSDGSFGGTPAQWSTRRASTPLDRIRMDRIANPLIVLDEIDKTGTASHNGSLLHAVLPMLETHTSSSYFETGLEMSVDLSAVNFIATANDLERVPTPLLDRMRIIKMPDPGPEHIGDLSRRIVGDILRERGLDPRWSPPLAPDEVDVIRRTWGSGSIRKLRRAIEATLSTRETMQKRGMQ